MKIKLQRPFRISADGVTSALYAAGDVVDLPDVVASGLIRDRIACHADSVEGGGAAPDYGNIEPDEPVAAVEVKIDGPAETKPAGRLTGRGKKKG